MFEPSTLTYRIFPGKGFVQFISDSIQSSIDTADHTPATMPRAFRVILGWWHLKNMAKRVPFLRWVDGCLPSGCRIHGLMVKSYSWLSEMILWYSLSIGMGRASRGTKLWWLPTVSSSFFFTTWRVLNLKFSSHLAMTRESGIGRHHCTTKRYAMCTRTQTHKHRHLKTHRHTCVCIIYIYSIIFCFLHLLPLLATDMHVSYTYTIYV